MLVNPDKSLNWAEVETPRIKAGEILIKVHAAAVNRADLLQRDGQYPPPPGCPEWLGLEIAGEIVEMSPEAQQEGRYHMGEMVMALLGGGGYAEYAAVSAGMVMPIPHGVSCVEAAAMPEAFGAAYLFLFVEGGIKPGDTLLMQAGASGLASVVIPLAHAFGVRVITSVLTDRIAASITHLKAERVVVTERECLAEVMKEELEAGHGVDIVIDCLGADDVGTCLPFMNRGGRWMMIATLAGDMSNINLRQMYMRGTRLIGTTLRSRTPEAKAQILANLVRDVWPKVESGEVRPKIYKVLPITQADEAFRLMHEGISVGKLVLTVE